MSPLLLAPAILWVHSTLICLHSPVQCIYITRYSYSPDKELCDDALFLYPFQLSEKINVVNIPIVLYNTIPWIKLKGCIVNHDLHSDGRLLEMLEKSKKEKKAKDKTTALLLFTLTPWTSQRDKYHEIGMRNYCVYELSLHCGIHTTCSEETPERRATNTYPAETIIICLKRTQCHLVRCMLSVAQLKYIAVTFLQLGLKNNPK